MRHVLTCITVLFLSSTIFGQSSDSSLKISRITGDFYVYTTFNLYNGSRIPANGMYVVTDAGVILFDTPWDTTQFQPLLDTISIKHHLKVILCISTHFHDDRTAGLEYYRQQGIKTFTTLRTDELSMKRGKKRAEFLMYKDTVFKVGRYSFEVYYPGPGHTEDNIVIWFNKQKILYGGCLIKSMEATDLGYLQDANLKEYASTIEKVKRKFPYPKYVVPGHDDWQSIESLEHTLILAKRLENKK